MTKKIGYLLVKYPLFLINIIIILLAIFLVPSFATIGNVFNIIVQFSAMGVAAIALTIVIISGGIDLSIAANLAFSALIGASIMSGRSNIWGLWGILLTIAVALLISALNALFIVKIGMHHFITTISMQILVEGIALWFTESKTIAKLPFSYLFIGRAKIYDVPLPIIIFFIIFFLANFLMTKTSFGRSVYAIGGNRNATIISGINVTRVRIIAYMLCGVCAAVGGILLTGRLGAANPVIGRFLLLDIVSACILGGASLFGGRGNLTGTLYGVILIGLISNILNLLGILFFFTLIIKGAIIVLAVIIDYYQNRYTISRR